MNHIYLKTSLAISLRFFFFVKNKVCGNDSFFNLVSNMVKLAHNLWIAFKILLHLRLITTDIIDTI